MYLRWELKETESSLFGSSLCPYQRHAIPILPFPYSHVQMTSGLRNDGRDPVCWGGDCPNLTLLLVVPLQTPAELSALAYFIGVEDER